MPHDAHTLNAWVEMVLGWQDSLMLKLALQPVGSHQSVADLSQISCRLVAEDFTAKVFMKLAINRGLIANF